MRSLDSLRRGYARSGDGDECGATPRGWRIGWWRLLAVALIALAAGLDRTGAGAQQSATVDLVSAVHFVDGRVVAGLRAQPADALDVGSVTVTVDGVAREGRATSLAGTDPKAIAIVIDTSGSMAGEPIVAARRAVSDLIRLLPTQDQIALVSFSDGVRVLVPFTGDRGALLQASESLFAAGNTSLYEAVAVGSELLATAPQADRRMVLLSDGLDFGGTSKRDRGQSIEAARASKAAAFAFGFGKEADREYLAAVARETGGRAQEIADANSLRSVFTELGGLLGATHEVTVTVPLVATGEHRLAFAASAGGRRITGERRFAVTNEGLLSPSMSQEGTAPDQLVVVLGSRIPLEGAEVRVVAGGRSLTMVPGAQRVVLDPWGFKPGPLELQISVLLGGAPVTAATFNAEVPAFAPSLLVGRAAAPGQAQIRWRVQAATEPWTVRAIADGRELGRWEGTDSDATVAIPDGNPAVQVELLRPDGTVATQQVLAVGAGASSTLLLVAAVLLASGGGGLVWMRRRPTPPVYTPTNVTPLRRPRGFAMSAPPAGAVVVVRGSTEEARYDIGQRPLTIGSAQECDIVVADENVRPFHARLTLDRDGVLRVHGLAGRGPSPAAEAAPGDQWVRLEPGAELGIGEHLIRLESA